MFDSGRERVEASIIGCHGYLYSNVYLSLHVSHEALCGTVVVHEGDIGFLREKGGKGGGEKKEEKGRREKQKTSRRWFTMKETSWSMS